MNATKNMEHHTTIESRMERATAFGRLLGAATGPSRHCDICGTWAAGRNIITTHERREVRLHGCDSCYASHLYGRTQRSVLAKAAAVRAAIDDGARLRNSTTNWRTELAALKSQTDRARHRPASHFQQARRAGAR